MTLCFAPLQSVKNQLKYSNNVNAMVSAGSKGSSINICQVSAAHRHTPLHTPLLLPLLSRFGR